ncbi:MAG: dUTP [Beijerinckiaceae bacterium]|nr:MAG: dUTP [Beijerinckiaceae bacterium]
MTSRPRLSLKRLPHAEGLPLPAYQSTDAAGFDLPAAIAEGEPLVLAPGARMLVPTGFIFELQTGFEAQVRPRSGLALKNGVTVLNAPGTIDADYRGEVQVILVNHGRTNFAITRGMRIAQCVIAPVVQAAFVEIDTLAETARGEGGFGSTGV